MPHAVSPTASDPSQSSVWSAAAGPATSVCAWCASSIDEGDRHEPGLVWCGKCGVASTSPWPTDDQLATAYGNWYRPAAGRFSGPGDTILRHSRATLAQRVDRSAPAGQVVDVGAGDGTLVNALRSCGRDAIGLEREASGPHIQSGEITDLDGSWAAVIFWHSLEHLREPGEALKSAATLLAPGGVLFVAVPNIASLQAERFGSRWFALDLPRHLTHIPAKALVAKLGEIGLTVQRVSHIRGGQVLFGWVHGLVGRLPGHPDLYDAIRSPEARSAPMSARRRLWAFAGAALVMPFAVVMATVEVLRRRGGSVYVEARR